MRCSLVCTYSMRTIGDSLAWLFPSIEGNSRRLQKYALCGLKRSIYIDCGLLEWAKHAYSCRLVVLPPCIQAMPLTLVTRIKWTLGDHNQLLVNTPWEWLVIKHDLQELKCREELAFWGWSSSQRLCLILRVFVVSARNDHVPVVKIKALHLITSAISRCVRYYVASVFHF